MLARLVEMFFELESREEVNFSIVMQQILSVFFSCFGETRGDLKEQARRAFLPCLREVVQENDSKKVGPIFKLFLGLASGKRGDKEKEKGKEKENDGQSSGNEGEEQEEETNPLSSLEVNDLFFTPAC